jgi:hypothetical protein
MIKFWTFIRAKGWIYKRVGSGNRMIMKDIERVQLGVTVEGPDRPRAGRFGLTEASE